MNDDTASGSAIRIAGFCGRIRGNGETSYAGKKTDVQLPIHSITITIPKGTKEALFDQLRHFADTHEFAIRIAPITPDGEQFGVQMYREDIKMLGNNALDTEEVFIGFYPNGENQVPAVYLSKLVDGLKEAVKGLPGATISKEE